VRRSIVPTDWGVVVGTSLPGGYCSVVNSNRALPVLAVLSLAAVGLAACAARLTAGPMGNRAVPQPAKSVDLQRYVGLWYELARYENRFERNCEAVTAEYRTLPHSKIEVVNSCHKGAIGGPLKVARGRARSVPGSRDAKLKVSFFGPFLGDYWVLDHADDYSWSIVGEPSGRYLWILTREANPRPLLRDKLQLRARELGYDTSHLRWTAH
jgi:apolipoprotein D and lipocalin family protein